VTHDLSFTLTLDELAYDSGRTVMLPVKAIEALLARYARGKPAGLAQDERSGVTGRLDLNAMRPRTAVPGARSRSSGAEVRLREGHA
jgi:hypothetical protein